MTNSYGIITIMANSTLENGIVGSFGFFIAIRLLLWLLFYNGAGIIMGNSAHNTISIQTVGITLLLESLTLIVLVLPQLRSKIDKTYFALLLMFSSSVLLFGHARMLAYRDFEGLPNIITFHTPFSMFLFTTVVFVAWQYDLRAVLLYSGTVTGVQLILLWQFHLLTVNMFIITIFMAPLTMLLPGWLIARMMTQQRQQQTDLADAAAEQARINEQLVHYATSLEELTISRERNRLARELHDTLAHSLSAVIVQLGAVETLWENSPDVAKALLAQADMSARDGLEEARRALQALRVSPLEDLGLVLALEVLAKEAAERANATLHLNLPEDKLSFLEPYIEQNIYRVAQEALENSVRHAEASQLWVLLANFPEQIQLTIRDNGRGFEPSKAAINGHYGVAGMRERAGVIGGRLTVESEPLEGTTIQLAVPLKQHTPRRRANS